MGNAGDGLPEVGAIALKENNAPVRLFGEDRLGNDLRDVDVVSIQRDAIDNVLDLEAVAFLFRSGVGCLGRPARDLLDYVGSNSARRVVTFILASSLRLREARPKGFSVRYLWVCRLTDRFRPRLAAGVG